MAESDKEPLSDANAALLRMSDSRAIEINISGPLLKSKLAWKAFVYRHGLHHRIVGLADAIALCLNGRNTLGAFLGARAQIETTSLVHVLQLQLIKAFETSDLGKLNQFLDNATFSTRDPVLVAEYPEIQAKSILSAIDRFDKELTGIRGHYDRLSERCHPNALGQVSMFSRLDRSSGAVSFYEEKDVQANAQSILAGYMLVRIAEIKLSTNDELVIQISELQNRLDPVASRVK
ncbi:hypothetical protein HLI03_06270 [Rhizobium laguerreae]|uniref:hypothetical protein n=1 Tax=Rhizobium laguerreae TaxID=1076926 RepID=UPI0014795258|nr:hypothetical protein [Rhizobium laguerreae]NNH41307.1 hypothetical protein [Rhizobium laguerreae]